MAPLLCALLFLSGFCGLVYEVLWARQLALVLGHTAGAQALVLGVFMGGLGLGSAFFGRAADRCASPLRLYGLLELGVGLCALASPYLIDGPASPFLALALLPPAALMGGTLPALTRCLVRDLDRTREAVASFYASNSAGAALGALLAGLWLIPAFGLTWPVLGAAALNLAVGAAALALSTRPDAPRRAAAPAEEAGQGLSAAQMRVLYASAALSGAAAISYEVAWTRLLALALGSSVYAFSLMLAAFIAGISLGGALARRPLPAGLTPFRGFGLAQAGVALSVLLTLPLYERLPFLHYLAAGLLRRTEAGFALFQGFQLLMSFVLSLAPAAFMGLSLPLAAAAAPRRLSGLGGAVGGVFGVNALGNVAGAVLAGLVLLPALGLQRLVLACVLANLASAAAVGAAGWSGRRRSALLAGCGAAAAWALLCGAGRGWDRLILSAGEFRGRLSYEARSFSKYREKFRGQSLLFCRDDSEATITVDKDGGNIVLKTNGKPDASSVDDLPMEVLFGHVPFLLRPKAQDVLMVGLGSGITAGAILAHPVRSLDLVEISRGVVEAERFFQEFNGRPLQDPRLSLHVEDAKTFLRRAPRLYDLINSEPSNPWIAGVGSLFSVDFYREAKARLKPDGVMVQWFHLYEMDDETLRLILRTFCSQFEHVELWEIPPAKTDILLVGSRAPIRHDFPLLEAELLRPAVAKDLSRIGARRLPTLLALQSASDRSVRELAGEGRVNEDQFPVLEYAAPKALFLMGTSDLVSQRDERLGRWSRQDLPLTRYLRARGRPLSTEEFAELAGFQRRRGGALAVPFLEEWARRFPRDPEPLRVLAELRASAGDAAAALEAARRLLALRPGDAAGLNLAAGLELELYLRGRSYLTDAAPDRALFLLRRLAAAQRGAARAQVYQKMAEIHANTGSLTKAEGCLAQAAQAAAADRAAPPADSFWVVGARMALDRGDRRAARRCLDRALRLNPVNAQARALLQSAP